MRVVKKTALIAGLLLLALIMVPGLYALLYQEKVTTSLISKVNESVNTKISYRNLRITIFESFPNISVRFNDLLVEPSPSFDLSQFTVEDADTLLYSSSLSLTVSMPSLLTGTVAVKSITARDGKVNLLSDSTGDINYQVFSGQKGNGKNVRLKNISIQNIRAAWDDRQSGILFTGNIEQAVLGGEIFRTGIYLTTSLNAVIDSLSLNGSTIRDLPVVAGVKLRKSASSLSVAKGSLSLADLRFDVTGNINYSNSTLNLTIDGKKIDIASIVSRLPEKWRAVTGTFSPSGIVDLRCRIEGPYGEAGTPWLEMTYGLSRGRMSHQSSGFKVNNLEFSGKLTNGNRHSAETFSCTVDRFTARYGSASVKGSFMLTNLNKPYIVLAAEGDLDFDDLNRVFRSGLISDQSGKVTGSVRLAGRIPANMKPAAALPDLNPEISLLFNDFSGSLNRYGIAFSEVNGKITSNNDLVAQELSLTFREQHLTVNMVMKNFIPWLSGRGVMLEASGNISADRIIAEQFIPLNREKTSAESREQAGTISRSVDDQSTATVPEGVTTTDNPEKSRERTSFPADITADLIIEADTFSLNNLRVGSFKSRMTYKPYVITFSEAGGEGLDGALDGEFMLGRQKDGDYITRAILNLENIDIHQAFSTFNNFRQDFIVSENLSGRLTGSLSLLSPLDENFNFIMKAIVAEAHLQINNGVLANFAPAESLSSYLDLAELKRISFSRMENDIFIKNSVVSIPKMLINSSAVNFTVYGTHSFEGNYSYHTRLLLSEVLSRKAREKNRNVSQFGQVKVDGSGKATVPLKIERINNKSSVSYDFAQAQDNIRSDIAVEKQTLRGILNEEYGWYKTDSTRESPAESKPKFSIIWEEGREQPVVTDTIRAEVKERPLKELFRKKR